MRSSTENGNGGITVRISPPDGFDSLPSFLAKGEENALIDENKAKTKIIRNGFMGSYYGMGPKRRGKEICTFFLGIFLLACGCTKLPDPAYLRIIINPLVTLNPRHSVDATGQRIGALLFRALTKLDSKLAPVADLASEWKISRDGKIIEFFIRPDLADQGGRPIDAKLMAECLENYRLGQPIYSMKGAFPKWSGTAFKNNSVFVHLTEADPYFERNASLLRYFRVEGQAQPCGEAASAQPIIASGLYHVAQWNSAPEDEIKLEGPRPIQFLFVPDDNTKLLKLMRGEVDGIMTALSLTKTRWVQAHLAERFRVLEHAGTSVSYMAFNLTHPILSQLKVRQALAHAIPRDEIVREKMFGFGEKASSLLSPLLPESFAHDFDYDPKLAAHLLDEAGYPLPQNGFRFSLHYKTTPVREGLEAALIFQNIFEKIGVKLILDVVEPAVFFSTIRKGAFELYSSRWLGVADGSILYRTLHSSSFDNRVHYKNKITDELLERGIRENSLDSRKKLLAQVQEHIFLDLPYFPLWYWNGALIIDRKFKGLEANELSLSEGLEPLTHLR